MRTKEWLKVIGFSLVMLIVIVIVGEIVRPKDSSFDAYYSVPDNTVDVIVVGSSHVYCGYIPALLWDEYGISSFNVYGWSIPTRTAYAYVVEALKTQELKAVVIDVASFFYGVSPNTDEIDAMNYSGNINFRGSINRFDLMFKDAYESINRKKLGEINDITKYHNNWKSPEIFNQTTDPSRFFLRNFGALYSEIEYEPFILNFYQERREPIPVVQRYIEKLEKLSKEKGFELIYIMTPCDIKQEEMEVVNWFTDYCAENGYSFLNIMDLSNPTQFDYQHEMGDIDHVNYKGAEKITRYLGNYLVAKLDFPDPQSNADRERISKDARMTRKMLDLGEITVDTYGQESIISWILNNKETVDIIVAFADGNRLSEQEKEWLLSLGIDSGLYGDGGIVRINQGEITDTMVRNFSYECSLQDHLVELRITGTKSVEAEMDGDLVLDASNGILIWIYDYDFGLSTYAVSVNNDELRSCEISTFLRGKE